MESILITGGFGYVGGRLAQHLERDGRRIVLGSRRPASSPEWLPTAAVVETSWHSDEALARVCQGKDAVIHLAGMNAQECAADPAGALDVNALATSRLLQAATRAGVKRFIYVSTAHVYGSPLCGSITEESRVLSLHPYATSHRAGEDVVRFAHQQKTIQGIVIRLSNAFGPPVHEHVNCWMLLVNDLCRQAVNTRQMVLRSSGMQRRDFVSLTDVCRAIAHLLNLGNETLGDGLYNLGGGWAPTVMEMTERIGACCHQLLGYRPEITRPNPQPNETSEQLDYRIDKILHTGFTIMSDVDLEIIETLKFCASKEVPHR